MKVINIFTSVKPYKDVIEVLAELDSFVDENIIIARDQLPIEGCRGRLRFIVPEMPLSGLGYWIWAAKQARAVLNSMPSNDWIVTEHVVGVSILILKYWYRSNAYMSAFLVFPTFEFLCKRGWSIDPYARLSLKQKIHWLGDTMKRSILEAITYAAADGFLANSNDMLRWAKGILWWKQGYLFPNAVKCLDSGFSIAPKTRKGKVRMLYVGQMQPHKGVATAIEVHRRICSIRSDFELVLVGPVAKVDEEWLLEQVQRDPSLSVRYLGKVPFNELPKLYSEHDIFLFPSFFEGSPRVVQEAMQYGCSVVAAKIDGNELIDCGKGFIRFFEPGDVDGAVGAILGLMEDPSLLLNSGSQSRRHMVECFSPHAIASRLHQAYSAFLRGSI